MSEIETAEKLFDEGNFVEARKLLAPLVEQNNGAAIRLNCSHFDDGTSEEEKDRIYVDGMFRAAECGDLEALYTVGVFYDIDEYPQVPQDKEKASAIFKQAADLGHAHCMWIHATELLWGKGSFEQSIHEGSRYLDLAIDAGSAEACITKARLMINGELGFEKNDKLAKVLRKQARLLDDNVFDPFE